MIINSKRAKISADTTKVKSLSERFYDMKESTYNRVTCGKSGIHGWGAFAKVGLRHGDMVIEYQGELIRQKIADKRETEKYDKLVGAGTYIFNIKGTYFLTSVTKIT